ncbi:ParB/RepB/Spo0J family partition protein [Sphaerospermopsis aphanizomenoides BCCUSP55]|uniref:ParB/RepB/Spo0J family partition protein n=1 Tax=Sphaerospermopsis aphanizomenoides TaxID=459663 RepID=UPI000ABC8F48|nr:ParB/RepB/Spo0J family partition protein [Sphaerospermopsis aphanizomenoides BCCUSP55]
MVRKRTEKPFAGQITTPPPAPWLSSVEADTPPATESKVKLQDIHLPPQQPRHYFDPQALTELVASVKQHGILQPLLVRPLTGGKYELVAGERRYRAATEVGLEEVPVVVRELSDDQAFQLALIENLQRQDLNPVEETEGILHLLAIRLESDVEAVKSLLYRMKNASNKGEKPSKDTEEQSRRNVSPNSETTEEIESPSHVPTDLSGSVSPTENGETTPESLSNVSSNLETTEETQSRRNVSPNSEITDETESGSNVSTHSETTDATASGKNISPNSGTTTLKKSRRTVSQDADIAVSSTEESDSKDESRRNVSPNTDTAVSSTEESDSKDESGKNVSPDSGITEEIESRRNVSPNVDEEKAKKVQEVFESLGLMNWLSFTTKRLPLLNLPLEILKALREGKLEYTKAQALARVKDDILRQQLLDQAIAHNWSLSEIKAQIAANTQRTQPPSSKSPNQIERLKNITQRINKSKLWEQPAKQKKLETLLSKLEALLGDESP